MTELTRSILERYQIRKTKKQKEAFIHLLQQQFPDLQVQQGGFPKCRNIIIGDVENAKLLLSAHYDTCARLPFPNFITPKQPVLSILYGFLIAVPIFLVVFVLNLVLNLFTDDYMIHYWSSVAVMFLLIFLMFAGPANKHTANDNTSGVAVLCELLTTLTPEQRRNTAFVFFDHEESGLLGSALFRKKYKKLLADKLLVNFDCVSDGDHILVAASKAARGRYANTLRNSFLPSGEKSIVFSLLEKVYYPSDQSGFPMAVAVASMRHKRFPGYYITRIHTNRDTVFEEKNIKLLCDSVLRLMKKI